MTDKPDDNIDRIQAKTEGVSRDEFVKFVDWNNERFRLLIGQVTQLNNQSYYHETEVSAAFLGIATKHNELVSCLAEIFSHISSGLSRHRIIIPSQVSDADSRAWLKELAQMAAPKVEEELDRENASSMSEAITYLAEKWAGTWKFNQHKNYWMLEVADDAQFNTKKWIRIGYSIVKEAAIVTLMSIGKAYSDSDIDDIVKQVAFDLSLTSNL